MKFKVIAILLVAAALAGGWKWSNPTGGRAAAAPAASVQASAYTPDGWSWGEEAS